MHITDPTNFPISASATYAPHAAPLTQALQNASRLNLPNLVFVQPSTYGTNNACLLAALDRVGPDHGRGVVAFDPTKANITTLRQWHARGVRGVRINLKSAKQEMASSALRQLLRSYADAIRPMRTWALELFVDMAVAGQLEEMVPELSGVKLVLAHLGSPGELKMPLSDMRGWDALLRMMRDGGVYVKVSGPYRSSKDPEYWDLEGLTKELFGVRGGDRVVFASDWPHTRFEGVDVRPWVERCLEWCEGDEGLRDKLFRDNARELWDVR